MKKLFLGAAIAISSLSFAQTFGAKAGLNVSNVSEMNADSKAGFYAGILMNAPITEKFNIQPELLYNSLGAKSGSAKLNLDYISVPVMFQYKIAPSFYLEAGPQASILVGAKVKSGSSSVDVKSGYQSFDLGAGIGLGYAYKNYGVNARYVAGITDVLKSNSGNAARNGAFQVGVSYQFGK